MTGERFEGEFEGHRVELVRNIWERTIFLRVDGRKVPWDARGFPCNERLEGVFEHQGVKHKVVAHAMARPVFGIAIGTCDLIEIDGQPFRLDKTR